MANLLQISVSALKAHQTSLQTVGNNISNASTPEYSRQDVIYSTLPTQKTGRGYVGSGVETDGIRRIYDEFVVADLRTATTNFNRTEIYYETASQIDNLLGEDSTSLMPALSQFFNALHSGTEDPRSLPVRQLVLSQADLLVSRINTVQERLDDSNSVVNAQLINAAEQINSLSYSIASLNQQIAVETGGEQGRKPNSLLDNRDELIRQLNELVAVNVVENEFGQTNLYLGNGQSLVIASDVNEVVTRHNEQDGSREDMVIVTLSGEAVINDAITGGKVAGLLSYREEVLDASYNRLGQVALSLQSVMNEQHRSGMDLDEQIGGDFFVDVNSETLARRRVFANDDNQAPKDHVMELRVSDIGDVGLDDYEVVFPDDNANEFTIVRTSTGEEVLDQAFNNSFPFSVEFEGLELTFVSGTYNPGDRFLLLPTRYAARDIEVQIDNPRDIAFAQPVRSDANVTNRGTGNLVSTEVLDTTTSLFANEGELTPPIIIEFTSPTRYNVLDNSDPSNPVDMDPPLNNLIYVPGKNNELLPGDEGQTVVRTDGSDIASFVTGAAQPLANGYAAEDIFISHFSPDTAEFTNQSITTALNDTAADIAAAVDALDGVSATASNYAVISNITSATPITIEINGEIMTGAIDADTLADAINSNTTLTADGLYATSNGTEVTLRATTGVDFQFQVTGGAADNITITNINGASQTIDGAALPAATLGGLVDVTLDENYSLSSNSNGVFTQRPTAQPNFLGFQIVMNGNPVEGDTFDVTYNNGGFSDNRNAVKFVEMQNLRFMNSESQTLSESYGALVDIVGTLTQEAEISKEAAEVLLNRAKQNREAVSGVNLDEEATRLLEFEMAYNAMAQVINTARTLFDTLLNSVG